MGCTCSKEADEKKQLQRQQPPQRGGGGYQQTASNAQASRNQIPPPIQQPQAVARNGASNRFGAIPGPAFTSIRNVSTTSSPQQVLMQSPHVYQVGAGAWNVYACNGDRNPGRLLYKVIGDKFGIHHTQTIFLAGGVGNTPHKGTEDIKITPQDKALIVIRTKVGYKNYKTFGYIAAAGNKKGQIAKEHEQNPLFTATWQGGATHFWMGNPTKLKHNRYISVPGGGNGCLILRPEDRHHENWIRFQTDGNDSRNDDAAQTSYPVASVTHGDDKMLSKNWWIDCGRGIDPLVAVCLKAISVGMAQQDAAARQNARMNNNGFNNGFNNGRSGYVATYTVGRT